MAHREEEQLPIGGSELAAGIGVMFAATLMIVGGIMQVFQAISAIANDEFFVTLPNYVVTLDVSTWGWIHLVFGILVVIAGMSLFSGNKAAAIFALVLAVLSAIARTRAKIAAALFPEKSDIPAITTRMPKTRWIQPHVDTSRKHHEELVIGNRGTAWKTCMIPPTIMRVAANMTPMPQPASDPPMGSCSSSLCAMPASS